MEGWLQVPPERNLMGRGQWKLRYVTIARGFSGSSSQSPTTSARPTTSTTGAPIDHRHSLYSPPFAERPAVPHHGTSLSNGHELRTSYFLNLYKQKSDAEPILRYDLNDIASCYVGDLGIKHKRPYVILPTLIIHLKQQTDNSTAKSFRRRSHDNPYTPRQAQTALFFRPPVDGPDELAKWAKEIQRRISGNNMSSSGSDLYRSTTVSGSLLEHPPNSFLINGEPSTTLLSPSVRSQSSDVSSERRSVKSVSSEGGGSAPADSPSLSGIKAGPIDTMFPGLNLPGPKQQKPVSSPPPRRETILDRYFASTPNIPDSPMPGTSSIARFEALVNSDPNILKSVTQPTTPLFSDIPDRIPSPTQRALEFISGVLESSEDEDEVPASMATSAATSGANSASLPSSHPSSASLASSRSTLGGRARDRKGSASSLSNLSAETSQLSLNGDSYKAPTPLKLPAHAARYPAGHGKSINSARSAPPSQQNFIFDR